MEVLYTSYFAKIQKLPKNFIPVAICGKVPDWYRGLRYKNLAPKYDSFMEWRKTNDNKVYTEKYINEVLDNLNPHQVVRELKQLVGMDQNPEAIIVLICYEKIGDFCHRHLVSQWFLKNKIHCYEWLES